MDIKKYIASGILEQYAFDLLPPKERSEVEAHLQQHPELVDELRRIESTLEQYLSAQAVEPSPGFRKQLDEHLDTIDPDPAPPSTTSPQQSGAGGSTNYWLIGFALLSLAAAAWLFYDNAEKDKAHQELEVEYNNLQADCDETNEVNRGLLEQLQTIRQSGNTLIQMRATGIGSEDAIAAVVYNPETQESFLDVINLNEPDADQQYQLWAIVDGSPIDMGVFELGITADTSLISVPFIENAQAFAITLEPRGGSEVPTLDQMVVLGNVTG